MQEIFISYSRADSIFGHKLHQGLLSAGQKPWMDWMDIPPSSRWWQEIKAGIEDAATFIFIISPHSLASPVCHLEIAHARSLQKRIIPILLCDINEKEVFPSIKSKELGKFLETIIHKEEIIALAEANWLELSQINWIDFGRVEEYKEKLKVLLSAIETDLDYVREHTRLQVKSLEWEKEKRHADFLLHGIDLTNATTWLKDASQMLQPVPTKLQKEFIDASIAHQKAQEASKKRVRNRIVATVIAILLLPYLWLATRFYVDTGNVGSGLVIRTGDPGLKILPGFDFSVIGTDYSLRDIADPYHLEITNENIQGFWFSSASWNEKLFPLLQPSKGGLAYWRDGQSQQSINLLRKAVENGDPEAAKTLAYLAFLEPAEVDQIIDGLLPSLGGNDDVREVGLQSFRYIRHVSPELAASQADRLLHNSFSEPRMQVWSIEAAGILAENSNDALDNILTWLSDPATPGILSAANAFAAIVQENRPIEPAVIDAAIARAANLPTDSKKIIVEAILNQDLSGQQKDQLQETLQVMLSSQDSGEQVFAVRNLNKLGMRDPTIVSPVISHLRVDPNEEVRIQLPGILLDLADKDPTNTFEILSKLVNSDPSEFVRFDALQVIQGWFEHDPETVLSILDQASQDQSDLVRLGALEGLVDLELETSCCINQSESILVSKLDDESFDVRIEAAKGLLLLSDRVQNPQHLSLAAQVFSQLFVGPTINDRTSLQEFTGKYAHPEAVIYTAEILLPHMQRANSFQIDEYGTFFILLAEKQPKAVPSISRLLSSLLAQDEIRGEIMYYLWKLHQQHPESHRQTLAMYIERLDSGTPDTKRISLEMLSVLGTLDSTMAAQALDVIGTYRGDSNENLRVAAYNAIAEIGKVYPDLGNSYLQGFVDCIKNSSNSLQLACSKALLTYASGGEVQAPFLANDLYTTLASASLNPGARILIAEALVIISDPDTIMTASQAESLITQIDSEQDSTTQCWLAGVLAASDHNGSEKTDFAFSLLTRKAMHTDTSQREEIVRILLSLGRHQPSLSEKAIRGLEPFASDSEFGVRSLAIISIREIGLENYENAQLALESLMPTVTSQEDDVRWHAIANGVEPLLTAYPQLASKAVKMLDISNAIAIDDLSSVSSLSQIRRSQILAYAILAEDTPDMLWPMVTSPDYDKRIVGRAAMLHLLKNKPELVPIFESKLASLQKGCRPQACLSISQSNELIYLLQNPSFMKLLEDAGVEGKLIDWLPSGTGVDLLGSEFDPMWNVTGSTN